MRFSNRILHGIAFILNIAFMGAVIWISINWIMPSGSWINIVDGESMYPTLEHGQFIYTDMTPVERGDIIMLDVPEMVAEKYPEKEGVTLIKRIIGMPGELVEIKKDGIYINGSCLQEEYISTDIQEYTCKENYINKVQLDDDEYYVLGDNRKTSLDSRSFGAITEKTIIYKQSEKFTKNFYVKLVHMILMCILLVVLELKVDDFIRRVIQL